MRCQRCDSDRVLITQAHASDCQNYELKDFVRYTNYAPDISEICQGDDLFPQICLDCGQVQGTFPKPTIPELGEE